MNKPHAFLEWYQVVKELPVENNVYIIA